MMQLLLGSVASSALFINGGGGGSVVDLAEPDHWVVSSEGPDRNAHQGIIAFGDEWITVGNNKLERFDENWVSQASNTDPQGDMQTSGNMIDCFESGGYIRTVRERNLGAGGHYIEAWDATTLAYASGQSVAFTPGPNFVGFSTCCLGPTPNRVYGVSTSPSYIEVHDLTTGAHVADLPITGSISQCNGIHYREGYFYLACRPNTLHRVPEDGGAAELVLTMGSFTGMDGLTGKDGNLYVLMDSSWNGLLKIEPFWDSEATQTTGQSSGEMIVNGDFETQSMVPWQTWPTGFEIFFGGGAGGKPDGYIAQSEGGTAFMVQSFVIPQEAWDSVDAGTATISFSVKQFGGSTGTPAATIFNGHFGQLEQFLGTGAAPGYSAWSDRAVTSEALPVGARMILAQVGASGSSAWFDDISLSIEW